jgi:hypothetical protein
MRAPIIVRYGYKDQLDAFCLWLASHLPRRLAYWTYVVQGSRAMQGDDIVPEVGYSELLQRMTK